MAGLVKALSGSLVAALGLAALPVRESETRRIPALGAVRLAAAADGLSVTATSFDGTITTMLEAAAEGEMAVPLDRLAALARQFPADTELAITADDRAATITSGRQRDAAPIRTVVRGRGRAIRTRHQEDRSDLSRI
jgi:DNA polymerase III sliding clamp (beta) subunit (PCNA family)